MTLEEKYARALVALRAIAKDFDPKFNFELEHWVNGNFDDSFEYGVEVGEQYAAVAAMEAIKAIEEKDFDMPLVGG